MKMAFFGGVYSNYLALERAIADARGRGADELYCLGDLGAFGPHPDRTFPLLRDAGVQCIQGNYDNSIGNELEDCQCGYTDPRDNYFARISYAYTLANTALENRRWMSELPTQLVLERQGLRILLCHGSPRRTNEFLWESTTSTPFLERLIRQAEVDVILGTHTGIHWQRQLGSGRLFANVGALGRPANDGRPNVWYAMLTVHNGATVRTGEGAHGRAGQSTAEVEFIPVEYDHHRLAREMRTEGLPEEFVQTTLTGWWTTCLEILPGRERAGGRY